LFESISAGAVPVTNSALGLDELGLTEVPVFSSADELVTVIDDLFADRAGTADLALRLAAIVRARHTYEHRANQVDGPLRELAESTRSRTERSAAIAWMATERRRANRAEVSLQAAQEHIAYLYQEIEEPPTVYLVRGLVRRLPALPARALRAVRGTADAD